MTPAWEIRVGGALELLRAMPDESVQCVVTSPPYFGLRDYGTGEWSGGDDDCEHEGIGGRGYDGKKSSTLEGRPDIAHVAGAPHRGGDPSRCRCGAVRVDQQIGLEPTPEEFVGKLVEVFREVRRVLRSDGTCWVNIGDSYCSQPQGNGGPSDSSTLTNPKRQGALGSAVAARRPNRRPRDWDGIKPKDLIGIPWMLAFALRADGWYLRSEVVWSKSNPMPESVRDRPTKAHEQIFLLTRARSYYYDGEAIREPLAEKTSTTYRSERRVQGNDPLVKSHKFNADVGVRAPLVGEDGEPVGGNKRTVWEVSSQPYPGAHFATFPQAIVEPCILAGTSRWACGQCGAPFERILERTAMVIARSGRADQMGEFGRTNTSGTVVEPPRVRTIDWRPRCSCSAEPDRSGRCVVLDPFAGAGTTLMVAVRLGRDALGLELNPEYAELARERIETDIRLGHRAPVRAPEPSPDQASLFEIA